MSPASSVVWNAADMVCLRFPLRWLCADMELNPDCVNEGSYMCLFRVCTFLHRCTLKSIAQTVYILVSAWSLRAQIGVKYLTALQASFASVLRKGSCGGWGWSQCSSWANWQAGRGCTATWCSGRSGVLFILHVLGHLCR